MSYFIYTKLFWSLTLLDRACFSTSINATVINENVLLIYEVRQAIERRQCVYPEMKFSCNGSVKKCIYGAIDQNR